MLADMHEDAVAASLTAWQAATAITALCVGTVLYGRWWRSPVVAIPLGAPTAAAAASAPPSP